MWSLIEAYWRVHLSRLHNEHFINPVGIIQLWCSEPRLLKRPLLLRGHSTNGLLPILISHLWTSKCDEQPASIYPSYNLFYIQYLLHNVLFGISLFVFHLCLV